MKQIVLLSSLFVFSLLVSCGESKQDKNESKQDNNEPNSSIKVQDIGLEVMSKNLGRMNWYEAKKACADLGDGWRLPTLDEIKKIYQYKDKIGGFQYKDKNGLRHGYWSSTEFNSTNAYWFDFDYGDAYYPNKSSGRCDVCAVRDLK